MVILFIETERITITLDDPQLCAAVPAGILPSQITSNTVQSAGELDAQQESAPVFDYDNPVRVEA